MKKSKLLRTHLIALAVALAHAKALRAQPAAGKASFTGNINVYGGIKFLNDSYFDDSGTADQRSMGATIDFGRTNWPVHILAGYFSSEKTGTITPYNPTLGNTNIRTTDTTQEARLGVRKIYELDACCFTFLGGGVSQFKLHTSRHTSGPDIQSFTETITEKGPGLWFDVGAGVKFTPHFVFGGSFAYTRGEVRVDNTDVQIGGQNYMAFIGYSW